MSEILIPELPADQALVQAQSALQNLSNADIDIEKLLLNNNSPDAQRESFNIELYRLLVDNQVLEVGQSTLDVPSVVLAIRKNHKEISECLLKHGAYPTGLTDLDYEIVSIAVRKGDLELVKSLIELAPNQDVDFLEHEKESPLQIAVRYRQAKIVAMLLNKGANANLRKPSADGPPLTIAIQKGFDEIVELLLLKKKIDLEYMGKYQDLRDITPLYLACKLGDPVIVAILLKSGANVDGKCQKRQRPIHVASEEGHLACVELLLKYDANLHLMDSNNNTALNVAVQHPDILKALLLNGAEIDTQNCAGKTPLHKACELGRTESVKLLLRFQADPTVPDNRGELALHCAVRSCKREVVEAVLKVPSVNPNTRDGSGNSPLHLAAEKANCEIFYMLITKGADLNARNDDGEYACLLSLCAVQHLEICPVVGHLKKLKLLGCEPNDVCRKKLPTNALDLTDERSENFRKELEIMRSCEIEESLMSTVQTLYDVVFMTRSGATSFAGNETLREMYERNDKDFEKQFPHYGSLLNLTYRKGLKRREMVESAQKSLQVVVGNYVPKVCARNIFKFLNDRQLKTMGLQNFVDTG